MPFVHIVDGYDDNSAKIDLDDDSILKDKNHLVVINLHYAFNGTTWERVQTDGSGNLKVTL